LNRGDGIFRLSTSSVRDFIQRVIELRNSWRADDLWFRGQHNIRHDLRPGTYRQKNLYQDEAEDERRYEFKRRAVQFPIERPPISDWEWYFLMQHYGLPTRLLDWSEGALIGLYFAVRNHPGTHDAAVWVLDPRWLQEHVVRVCGFLPPKRNAEYRFIRDYMPDPADERTKWIRDYLPETFTDTTLPSLPAPLRPPQIHRRIAAQLSTFTIHGRVMRGLERVARESSQARLAQIRIPKRRLEAIRDELSLCGIVETTVFPDFEGLGRELRDY
jgi:FRG domain